MLQDFESQPCDQNHCFGFAFPLTASPEAAMIGNTGYRPQPEFAASKREQIHGLAN